MAVKYSSLKVGDTIFEVARSRMGNAMMSTTSIYRISIVELDQEKKRALVKWNNNLPRWVGESYFARASIRRNKPETVESFTGAVRLKRRDEE